MTTPLLFSNIKFHYNAIFYPICIIISTILIRLILCFFKALAVKNGELGEVTNKWSSKTRRYIFAKSFKSSGKDFRINDYWLPALIGASELAIFPILMVKDSGWIVIGAWIGIKTASSWRGWQKTRTAYNRFLLGNILSLGVSWLLYLRFFKT
jgi:hypothetical protein